MFIVGKGNDYFQHCHNNYAKNFGCSVFYVYLCSRETQLNEGGQAMELQKVKMNGERLIPSGASMDGISIRRSDIAKVLWRELDVEVPASKIIANGVSTYKG